MRSRKLAVLAGLGIAAATTAVAVSVVGVANAQTVHTAVTVTSHHAAAGKDAAPQDNAHWSTAQRNAAEIAGFALEAKKVGAAKVLSSGNNGKAGIYVTKWITTGSGSYTVTVDVPHKTVITIAKS